MSLPGGISSWSLLSVCLLFDGVVLHIVGLATPEWSTSNVVGISYSAGLWKGCADGYCVEYPQTTAALEACEAMAIIGMFFSLFAITAVGILLVCKITGILAVSSAHHIAAALSIISFVFILIGIIVWGAEVHASNSNFKIGYSFILSIVGGVLIAIGGIMYSCSMTNVG
ncbi:epithelial membrane protein 1-like [Physella acuta]|uniref:epithelial membrane protein 1-like n=1 Tax=Physella acuta TaxID=109671 RepID=UPI0027DB7C12|nr:epithelial membrane protein 1-like [Physella acuta]XP_059164759.1 epithelial membrane protein 1-like [Physella acuta]XP_059164760.1 epithelial membrane protein 1-like [Physella acuta]